MHTTRINLNSRGGAITLQRYRVYPHKLTQTAIIRHHRIRTTVIQIRTCRRQALCVASVIIKASKSVINLSPQTVQTLIIDGWPPMTNNISNIT